jgi:hypothetical protein
MNTQKIIIEAHNDDQETAEGYAMISVNPNKPEYGSIRLATTTYDTTGGFLNKVRRVHFQSGKVEDLMSFADTLNLKVGANYSEAIPSRIIVEEQNVPFYEGQGAKINPSTGEIVSVNGGQVYRQTRLVNTSSSDQDILLKEGVATKAVASELTATDLPELG